MPVSESEQRERDRCAILRQECNRLKVVNAALLAQLIQARKRIAKEIVDFAGGGDYWWIDGYARMVVESDPEVFQIDAIIRAAGGEPEPLPTRQEPQP